MAIRLDLPDWSLVGALGISVFAAFCLLPQKMIAEARNPVGRLFVRAYLPVIRWALKWRKTMVTYYVQNICIT